MAPYVTPFRQVCVGLQGLQAGLKFLPENTTQILQSSILINAYFQLQTDWRQICLVENHEKVSFAQYMTFKKTRLIAGYAK